METRKFTTTDLVKLTGYTRHKLRSFLNVLPGFAAIPGAERFATNYTHLDLIVVSICCALEESFQLRREAIALLVPEIRKTLSEPRTLASDAILVLTINPLCVRYIDGPSDVREGTLLPLTKILDNVDFYSFGPLTREISRQRNLDLGLHPIFSTPSKKVSNGTQNLMGSSK